MKTALVLMVFASAFSAAADEAAAARRVPLLVKTTHTGFVPENFRTHTSCEIHPDRVVQTRSAVDIASVSERRIRLTGDVRWKIAVASLGTLSTEPGPIDGPTVTYVANRVLVDGRVKATDLGSNYGGNGTITVNSSPEAATLKNFIDMNCD